MHLGNEWIKTPLGSRANNERVWVVLKSNIREEIPSEPRKKYTLQGNSSNGESLHKWRFGVRRVIGIVTGALWRSKVASYWGSRRYRSAILVELINDNTDGFKGRWDVNLPHQFSFIIANLLDVCKGFQSAYMMIKQRGLCLFLCEFVFKIMYMIILGNYKKKTFLA